MRTVTPRAITMAKVMYEDENPQITAELLVQGETDEEPRWTPVGTKNPEFRTLSGEFQEWSGYRQDVHEVRWMFESWQPDEPTRVIAQRVSFIGYDDFAINNHECYLDRHPETGEMDSVVSRYSISNTTESEEINV